MQNEQTAMNDDDKIITIPDAATPPARDAHKDVKPVKMKNSFATPGLDYKREKILLKMSPEGAAIVRLVGEVDYDGDPKREAVSAYHVLVEAIQIAPKEGPTPIDVLTSLIVEIERVRHFSHIAGIQLI